MDWQRDAVCSPIDAALFTASEKPSDAHIRRLGMICAACPVTRECAQFGYETKGVGMFAGVWVYAKGAYRHMALEALKRKTGLAFLSEGSVSH